MTIDEITTTLRAFARSRKGGYRACPEYNSCGKIGCRMAEEAAKLIGAQRREFEDELEFSEDYSDILAWLNTSEKAEKALEAMKNE